MNPTPVLFIGDAAWPEFHDVHGWLQNHATLKSAADVSTAAELIEHGLFDPLLIVLAQRWPGEFTERQSNRLRRVAPLARISELLGSWCEGQTRTGDPHPATLRHYWHQWIARLAPEFARAERGECPVWGLPSTVTDEERLMALEHAQPKVDRGLLTIHTHAAEMGAALCAAAARRGFGAIWIRSRRMPAVSGVRAAIWDAKCGAAAEAGELAELRAALGRMPIMALVSFPRVEDREMLLASGASHVVSKPFWLDDLFAPLERLLGYVRQAVG
jgi:CheY-like chemotaxis protein